VRSAVLAGLFLAEFLSAAAGPGPLSALTPEPRRAALAGADRYEPHALVAGVPLVLVHGYTPYGKDDPDLRRAADLLARAGFEVLVPTIPGLTRGRLRPEDADPVVAALAARPGRAVLVGVSVGAGPALLAAATPPARERVAAVLVLGGYASALEVVRYWLTGEYAWGEVRGRHPHPPEVVRAFLDANRDLVDDATRAALATGDPARVSAALAALPPPTRALLDALSPERVAPAISARLILVHGRDDPAVPYTESLRLAAARPAGTQVLLVGAVAHVEGAAAGTAGVRDLGRLWAALYALTRGGGG
jgi:pimeloyl-ACP methyl ester carboxylesterase